MLTKKSEAPKQPITQNPSPIIHCKSCGNTHSFIIVETRSVAGEFHPEADGTLTFSPANETADLQHDHVKCYKCGERVTVEEFEWE